MDHKFTELIKQWLETPSDYKTLKLWAFITQVIERTYLADNHSKILLVRAVGNKEAETGDSGNSNSQSLISDSNTVQTVSVITSQNLTRGNRAESAFISTDTNIFASLYAQIEDLITNHSVPLNDLFRQRITAD